MLKATIQSALLASVLGLSFNTLATEQTSLTSGVVHNVDFKTFTLEIVNDQNGKVEEFTFSPSTRILFDGQRVNSRRALKPGQTVEFKLRSSQTQASL